jgi:energy-coupling factor transport system ATP-binding protein
MSEGRVIRKGTPGEVFAQVDEIRGLGLDVPQVTELMHEIGLEPVLSVDHAYDILKDKLGR